MEKALLDHLRRQQQAMTEMLAQLVRWESPSLDAEAQGPILDFFTVQLRALDYHCLLYTSPSPRD